MTLQDILRKASAYLKERNAEDPSKEAGLLLSWVLGLSLGSIYAHPDRILDELREKEFLSIVERRGRHEPFAYITGECEFFSLTFEVNQNVLIPRPDTESLAEAALIALGKSPLLLSGQNMFKLPKKEAYRILDIGTGSGCLAVSITKNCADVSADALDISERALETAKRNAERQGVSERINFIQGDFISDKAILSDPYDLIISNPPYIPEKDIPELMASVRDYEPHLALVGGGQDGLSFYRAIAEKAESLLLHEGIIAVECGFDQAFQVRELFIEKGMEALLIKDLSGIDRVVAAKKAAKV